MSTDIAYNNAIVLIDEILTILNNRDSIVEETNCQLTTLVKLPLLPSMTNHSVVKISSKLIREWCQSHTNEIVPKLQELSTLEVMDDVNELLTMIKLLPESRTIIDNHIKKLPTIIMNDDNYRAVDEYSKAKSKLLVIDQGIKDLMIIIKKELESTSVKRQLRAMEERVLNLEKTVEDLSSRLNATTGGYQ